MVFEKIYRKAFIGEEHFQILLGGNQFEVFFRLAENIHQFGIVVGRFMMKESNLFHIGLHSQVDTDKRGTVPPIFFFKAFTECVHGIEY